MNSVKTIEELTALLRDVRTKEQFLKISKALIQKTQAAISQLTATKHSEKAQFELSSALSSLDNLQLMPDNQFNNTKQKIIDRLESAAIMIEMLTKTSA